MDQEQLFAFDQIVRSGGYGRAAEALGISQPTLSARIQVLERDVGGKLFVRQGRGVALSDRGAAFLPYARRALEVLREGVAMGERAERGDAGRVTLAVLESLSGYFLGPVIAGYRDRHPEVSVAVRAGNHESLLPLLRDGVATLGLTVWPANAPRDLPLEPLCFLRESVVLVAAPGHPLARRAVATTADVLERARPFLWMRWWLAAPPRLTQMMERAADAVTVPFATAREMVLAGSGAGFFPWMQVADLIAAGRLRQIRVRDLPALSRASALVRVDRGAPLSAAALALVEAVRARAQSLGILARGRSPDRRGSPSPIVARPRSSV